MHHGTVPVPVSSAVEQRSFLLFMLRCTVEVPLVVQTIRTLWIPWYVIHMYASDIQHTGIQSLDVEVHVIRD